MKQCTIDKEGFCVNTSSTHTTATFTCNTYTFTHTTTTFITIQHVEYDEVSRFQGIGKWGPGSVLFHCEGFMARTEYYRCVVAATTSKKICYPVLEPPYQPSQQLSLRVKSSSFSVFLAQRQPVDHSLIFSLHRLLTGTWSSCRLSNFPLTIAHFWRETSLPSKKCTILSNILLGFRIAQSFQPTLPTGFVKIFPTAGCSA